MSKRAVPALQSVARRTAEDVLHQLFRGGGAEQFLRSDSRNVDDALKKLAGGGVVGTAELQGLGARDTGAGGPGGGGVNIGSIGGVGTRPGGGGPGPLVGLGPKKVEDIVCAQCTPKLAPGYDRDLVLKVVRKHQNEIRYCYETELQKHPELAGKVTVAWTIGATGSVESADIAESGLGNPNVEACIVQRVRRWNFPEPQGGQEVGVTFPWVFQVAGAE
jgi:TonB family protein